MGSEIKLGPALITIGGGSLPSGSCPLAASNTSGGVWGADDAGSGSGSEAADAGTEPLCPLEEDGVLLQAEHKSAAHRHSAAILSFFIQ